MCHSVAQRRHWIQLKFKCILLEMNTDPLLVWVNISNAKVIFLQQVEMVADEVKQVLSLGIPLKET